jgi:hypothetical protein
MTRVVSRELLLDSGVKWFQEQSHRLTVAAACVEMHGPGVEALPSWCLLSPGRTIFVSAAAGEGGCARGWTEPPTATALVSRTPVTQRPVAGAPQL